MSSHHIVKDQQEPALIVHRLESFDTQILHSLLEWSPTVVCCEPALERYLELGHKVDVALVDLSRNERWQEQLAHQHPLKIIATYGADNLETGLQLLQKDNHPAVNIITNEEAAFEVIDVLSDWMNHLNVVMFAGDFRYLFVKSGSFNKWLAAGSHCTTIALEDDAKWETNGFDQDSSDETDELNLSKSEEGEISIKCNVPFIVVDSIQP